MSVVESCSSSRIMAEESLCTGVRGRVMQLFTYHGRRISVHRCPWQSHAALHVSWPKNICAQVSVAESCSSSCIMAEESLCTGVRGRVMQLFTYHGRRISVHRCPWQNHAALLYDSSILLPLRFVSLELLVASNMKGFFTVNLCGRFS